MYKQASCHKLSTKSVSGLKKASFDTGKVALTSKSRVLGEMEELMCNSLFFGLHQSLSAHRCGQKQPTNAC